MHTKESAGPLQSKVFLVAAFLICMTPVVLNLLGLYQGSHKTSLLLEAETLQEEAERVVEETEQVDLLRSRVEKRRDQVLLLKEELAQLRAERGEGDALEEKKLLLSLSHLQEENTRNERTLRLLQQKKKQVDKREDLLKEIEEVEKQLKQLKSPEKPPSSEEQITKRAKFPVEDPLLCVAIPTFEKPVSPTQIKALLDYLESSENTLPYEVVGISQPNLTFAKKLQLERFQVHASQFPRDLLLSNVFFSLCRAPYVLVLTADFNWNGPREKLPLLQYAIAAMKHDNKILSLYLREPAPQDPTWPVETLAVNNTDQLRVIKFAILKSSSSPLETERLSYADGGVLHSRLNMLKLGLQENVADREADYRIRAFSKGLYGAFLLDPSALGQSLSPWFAFTKA